MKITFWDFRASVLFDFNLITKICILAVFKRGQGCVVLGNMQDAIGVLHVAMAI